MKYAIGKATKVERLICSICKEEIYTCNDCTNYFLGGDEIQCVDGEHYHKTCKIHMER